MSGVSSVCGCGAGEFIDTRTDTSRVSPTHPGTVSIFSFVSSLGVMVNFERTLVS